MKKIYAATDFSEGGNHAVKYAAEMAEAFKAQLFLVHVYESPMFYTAEMPYTAIETAENLAREDAEKQMNQLHKAVAKIHPGLEITPVIKRGISADGIAEVAETGGADLLVTGSTGAGVVERTLIGSTTTTLINKSKCLVLIVPHKARFKGIKSIVYATDLHERNIAAASQLLSFASDANAELVFLFIDNKIHSDSEQITEEMAQLIRTHVTYPKTSGYVCTDPDVMNGINLFIHKMKAEMVAMVTHKRSFPRMLWEKSLTKKFSYHPEVPLLVLHDAT